MPKPAFPSTGFGNLPTKLTDDDAIAVLIMVNEDDGDSDKDENDSQAGPVKEDSLTSLVSSVLEKTKEHSKKGEKTKKQVKIVRVTRGDHLKDWAHDEEGNSIGTEPEELGPKLWKDELARSPPEDTRERDDQPSFDALLAGVTCDRDS